MRSPANICGHETISKTKDRKNRNKERKHVEVAKNRKNYYFEAKNRNI